uniref:Uncharacterized protein n=1 Tax=Rhizophora mucronata TaxID=61149 RepID=A0A2P2MXT5_RHIMU
MKLLIGICRMLACWRRYYLLNLLEKAPLRINHLALTIPPQNMTLRRWYQSRP